MTDFKDRERAEEAKFAMDEEAAFKVAARRNRLLGEWAAGLMNLTDEETDAYKKEASLKDDIDAARTEGKRDATLVLIYPRPTSQANGYVYLPVYRSVYRLTDPALPLGVDPGLHPTKLTLLPQESNGTDPNWFAVPDGAVGRLEDADITLLETMKILQERPLPGRPPLVFPESDEPY